MADSPDFLLTFPLKKLDTLNDVAQWLGLSHQDLNWFSDSKRQQSQIREQQLHHYQYLWIEKRQGGFRLIEKPKARTKWIQRKILKEILDKVPVHKAAHGYVRKRSCKTHIANHVAQDVLLQIDLQDFFHSVPGSGIFRLFQTLGYPPNISHTLTGLCTTSVASHLAGPLFNCLPWDLRKKLQGQHLPQGAPTSGALTNLFAYRLDCRLQGLADRYQLHYSRYADDITFSGSSVLTKQADWIEVCAGAIATEEGFRLNHRKTRVQPKSQRQCITGIMVNSKPNVSRNEYDKLKAILHNCRKYGPESQNRTGLTNFKNVLEGKIAHISWLNPEKGKKLKHIFSHIEWHTT